MLVSSQPTDFSPQQSNIFVAAQRGDIKLLQHLIESGQARATDRDEQNISPLHWAAINAQLPACRYLLEQGAEVDALGGDLVATPMQWAARNGHLYLIQLLIAHGADPNIKDTQGYNTLHLVTHSSTVMPLLYLLHQPISVDERDAVGHTALMWAAYQGDALSVELLLKHGANPNTRDDVGLTPLHWAVVRGNKVCIRRLFEKGAEIHAKDNEGRTARDMAVELKSLGAWKRALEEGGFMEDGSKRKKPLGEVRAYLTLDSNLGVNGQLHSAEYQVGCVFNAHSLPLHDVYHAYRPPVVYGCHSCHGRVLCDASCRHTTDTLSTLLNPPFQIVTRVLLNKPTYTENVTASPYFSGIIFGSMTWVAYSWLTRLLQRWFRSIPFSPL
jgi:palmitoyltransferase ZDHHC13/17